MAKAKFERTSPVTALTGIGTAETQDKTGPALAEQTGTTQPATGTAAVTANAAGGQTLAADAAAPRKGPPGYTVVVTASQDRRWRIGRQFGREPVSIPAEELTEDEARALENDPILTLAVIDAPY